MHGVVSEEHVPQYGAWHISYHVLLMYLEQVGVGALEPQPAGVGFDVADQSVQLSFVEEDAVVEAMLPEEGGVICLAEVGSSGGILSALKAPST